MKSDNVFRFVSVRPPTIEKKISELEGDEVSIQEVDSLIREQMAKDKTPEAARLAAGRELIRSNRYFIAEEPIRTFVAASNKAQTLVQTQTSHPNFHSFQDTVLQLLTPINPQHLKLDKFLISSEYRAAKQSFWRSYYATVLAPAERPQDRQLLVLWLLVFYLLESPDDTQFKEHLSNLDTTRPAVPFLFFAETNAPEPPVEPLPRPERERLRALETRIASLQDARNTLNDLFTAKLRTFKQTPGDKFPQEAPGPAEGQPLATSASGGINLLRYSPWRVSDEDLQAHQQAFQLVRSLGVIPEARTLPDLINRLDSEIAARTADAGSLRSRETIAMVGQSLVKVRRPLFFTDVEEGIQ